MKLKMTERLNKARFLSGKTTTTEEKKAKNREYYQRPEVKAKYKERELDPDHIARKAAYRASPERKAKMAEYNRLRYSFELGMYDKLMVAQNACCAICQSPFTNAPRSIHSDHCHESNAPRGLLCTKCNHAEGFIKSIGLTPHEFASRLTAYLADPPARQFISKAT